MCRETRTLAWRTPEEVFMHRATNIHALLDAGLKAYGANDLKAAERCWRRVLELQPENEQAKDFLAAAGFEGTATSGGAAVVNLEDARQLRSSQDAGQRAALRARVARLVQERRLEDALEELDLMRPRFPEDASISRSIRLLRDQLVIEYGRRLGQLDQIPRMTTARETLVRSHAGPEVLALAALVDGIASLGDVIRGSHLGRFEAYRALMELQRNRWISLHEEEAPGRPAEPPAEASRRESEIKGTSRALPEARLSMLAPPEPSRDEDAFDALFCEAMDAYLLRQWRRSVELFERCYRLRPGDLRVRRNLDCIRAKLG